MISTVHSASSSENKNHSRIYGGRFRTKAQHEAKQEETQDTLCTRRGSAATLTVVVGGECVDSVDGGDVEAERVSFTLLKQNTRIRYNSTAGNHHASYVYMYV